MSHEVEYICIAFVQISDELHRVYRARDSDTGLNWRKQDAVGRLSNTYIFIFLVNQKFSDEKSRGSFMSPREKKKVKKKVFSVVKKMLFVKKSFHHFLHARLYE